MSIIHLLRQGLSKPIGTDVGALMSLLREIANHSREGPAQQPMHSAWLVATSASTMKEVLSAPLSLWSAVLPWERCRGLSLIASETFAAPQIPPPVLEGLDPLAVVHVDPERRIRFQLQSRGMLFFHPHTEHSETTHYWSGAITTPLDVAFCLRNPSTDWITSRTGEVPITNHSSWIVDSHDHLEPFVHRKCTVTGAYDWNDARKHTAQSRPGANVRIVLEIRRGLIDELLATSLSKLLQDDGATAAAGGVALTLQLSEALTMEMKDKKAVAKSMVPPLESRCSALILEATRPVARTMKQDQMATSVITRPMRTFFERGGDGTMDPSEAPGTLSTPFSGSTSGQHTSAKTAALYPMVSPGMADFPPLPYELVALCMRLGLCDDVLSVVTRRMLREVEDGTCSGADLQHLVNLVTDDVCLVQSEELSSAVLLAARAAHSN